MDKKAAGWTLCMNKRQKPLSVLEHLQRQRMKYGWGTSSSGNEYIMASQRSASVKMRI